MHALQGSAQPPLSIPESADEHVLSYSMAAAISHFTTPPIVSQGRADMSRRTMFCVQLAVVQLTSIGQW